MGNPKTHGFGYLRRKLRRSAAPRATTLRPRRASRFISLDTVAEGGGQSGNIDDPQYRWLKGELRAAKRKSEIVVAFGHHTLETMVNKRADEGAGKCDPADEPGCDRDPRKSTPIHRGLAGKQTIRALFAANPNVVSYVSGHTHANRVDFFKGKKGRVLGDQHRLAHRLARAEPHDRGHGQQGRHAVVGTLLDSAAPAVPRPPRARARRRARPARPPAARCPV